MASERKQHTAEGGEGGVARMRKWGGEGGGEVPGGRKRLKVTDKHPARARLDPRKSGIFLSWRDVGKLPTEKIGIESLAILSNEGN